MRRKEKQTHDPEVAARILREARTCRVGMVDHDTPYVVPMNFGCIDNAVFLHSATEGRKIDILRRHPKVCLQFDIGSSILRADNPCKWGVRYESLIAFGTAEFIDDPAQKAEGLNAILNHYSPGTYRFPDSALMATAVIKVHMAQITVKQSGV